MNSIGKKADKLKLKEADLYQPEGQKTVHAVLKGVRYGIPDPQTLQRIWGLDPEIRNVVAGQFRFMHQRLYAALQVLAIKDDKRGDSHDELRFRYAIQSDGSDSFANIGQM